jgi:alkylation response protein AidB-like acyl-CoA dehydrogenase
MTAASDATLAPAETVLDAVRDLVPTIVARAGEIERARRVPLDLVQRLIEAGCFRLLLPRSHGGEGADLMRAMRVYEELARADASVAWTVMIGAGAFVDLAGLPRPTFDALYAGAADVIVGGVINPSGVAVPVDGGYRVSGRWAFASGCQHCAWLYGNCIEHGDGGPQMRIALFPAAEVRIEDAWSVSGLCGTGSHTFVADDVFVPADRTYRLLEDETSLDEPLLRILPPAVLAPGIAAVAVGIARGALEDVLGLAEHKVPLLANAPLASNPLFQYQLAEADTKLRAARGLLYADAATLWATAEAAAPLMPELRARIRATSTWATAAAASVVGAAYRAGGGSSIYTSNPLQRRLRDIHALTQHFLVKLDTLTTAGAVLAGADADLTIF